MTTDDIVLIDPDTMEPLSLEAVEKMKREQDDFARSRGYLDADDMGVKLFEQASAVNAKQIERSIEAAQHKQDIAARHTTVENIDHEKVDEVKGSFKSLFRARK